MKKIFLVLFSLIMMCSVSFGIELNVEYKVGNMTSSFGSSYTNCNIGDYSQSLIYTILKNFSSDNTNEEYINSLNLLIEEIENQGLKYVLLTFNNYSGYWLLVENSSDSSCDSEIACYTLNSNNYIGLITDYSHSSEISLGCIYSPTSTTTTYNRYPFHISSSQYGNYFKQYSIDTICKTNCNILQLNNVTSNTFYWGGSYFYEVPEQDGGESGTDLTDEQIAEIVERFINSDAYLEKAYYNGDYFITYDNLTGYFRGYSYSWNIDLAIEYGNYDEEGNFVTTGTEEGEAWRIRPYEFSGDIFVRFGDWLASKFNTYAFEYFSISPDSSIEPRYIGSLEHNYCSNYKENEVVIYSTKQIRYVGEETDEEGNTETVVTDNYIPPTVLVDSETGEEIVIRDNLQDSSDSLENVITPNADFSGLKEAFEKYISFVNISSITWLTTAISSMIGIFVPFVALGIIIFLINRILNGGS